MPTEIVAWIRKHRRPLWVVTLVVGAFLLVAAYREQAWEAGTYD